MNRHRILGASLLLAAVLLAYWPAFQAGFVYDDHLFVLENPLVSDSDTAWYEPFLQPFPFAEKSFGWYRPLTVVSWRLNAPGASPSAPLMHGTNLGLHLVLVALVFGLARNRLDDAGTATATVFFALTPCHAEAVYWVSGRSELLAAVFVLAGLLIIDRTLAGSRRTAQLFVVFLIAALFSKESGIVLVPMASAVIIAAHRRQGTPSGAVRTFLGVGAATAVVVAAWFAVRVVVTGAMIPAGLEEFPDASVADRIALSGRCWWEAAVRLVHLPYSTVEYYWDSPLAWTWKGIAGWTVVGAGLLTWLRARSDAVRDGTAVTILGFALYAHLLGSTELFAERFLLLPSVGAALLFGAGGSFLVRRSGPKGLGAVLFVWGLAVALQIHLIGATWASDLALWTNAHERVPQSPHAIANLGTALTKVDRAGEALSVFALLQGHSGHELEGRRHELRALGQLGAHIRGVALAQETLARNPDDPETLFLLGRHLVGAGRPEDALRVLERLRNLTDPEARRWEAELAAQRPSPP